MPVDKWPARPRPLLSGTTTIRGRKTDGGEDAVEIKTNGNGEFLGQFNFPRLMKPKRGWSEFEFLLVVVVIVLVLPHSPPQVKDNRPINSSFASESTICMAFLFMRFKGDLHQISPCSLQRKCSHKLSDTLHHNVVKHNLCHKLRAAHVLLGGCQQITRRGSIKSSNKSRICSAISHLISAPVPVCQRTG